MFTESIIAKSTSSTRSFAFRIQLFPAHVPHRVISSIVCSRVRRSVRRRSGRGGQLAISTIPSSPAAPPIASYNVRKRDMARWIPHQRLRSGYLLPPLHPEKGSDDTPYGVIKEAGMILAASPEFSLVGVSRGPSSPTFSSSSSP